MAEFKFSRTGLKIVEKPRKVLLSPNKSLMLILGAYHPETNRKCLMVYQIFETYPNPFHLIFYDYAFSFIDVCFSPDSRSLVCITTRHPHHLFIMQLPLIECPHNKAYDSSNSLFLSATAKKNSEHHIFADSRPTFQARATGSVAIIGPAVSALTGQVVPLLHVVSSEAASENQFHFITWGESSMGEYCLWKLKQGSLDAVGSDEANGDGLRHFEMYPRTLAPEVNDLAWLGLPESPKTRIISARFSEAHLGRLMLVVQRESYGKQSDNGLGIQTCLVKNLNQPGSAFGPWYQISDSLDPEDLVCAKWTQPLLLGKSPSAAAVMQKKGFFELVSNRCGSTFQALNNESFTKCTNFVQVGRFHRYWSNGEELRAFVVTPQVASSHPEWIDLCRRGEVSHADVLGMRVLGRRVGYFIQDVQASKPLTLGALYAQRNKTASLVVSSSGKGAKKNRVISSSANSSAVVDSSLPAAGPHPEPLMGDVDQVSGIHLHRCWHCRMVLLKPLLCGRCKSAVYCSPECASSDWVDQHARTCVEPSGLSPTGSRGTKIN